MPLHPHEGVVASRPRLARSPASVPAAAARLGSRRSVPPWRERSRRSARQRSARRCASRRPTVACSRPRVQRARATSTQISLLANTDPGLGQAGSRADRRYTDHQRCSEGYADHDAYRGLPSPSSSFCPWAWISGFCCRRGSKTRFSNSSRLPRPVGTRTTRGVGGAAFARATLSPRQCLTSTYADGGSPPSPIRLASQIREDEAR